MPKTPQDAIFSGSDAHPSLFFLASFIRYLLGPIFGGFSTPTWHQKTIKIVHKSIPTCTLSWTSFSDRCLLDFCSQLLPPKSEKSSPRCSESTIFERTAVQVNIDFDTILVPTWLPFGSKNRIKTVQKSSPRGIKKVIDFCIDFWTILAPFGMPSWGHVGVMLGLCWGHVGHFFGKNDAWTQSWCSRGLFWCQRSTRYPVLGATGRGGTPSWAPRDRWGTPFLTDFEPPLGAKLLLSWNIWDNDFWIWPGGMREAIE